MEESYIIAFRAGSSGRFVANLLYCLLVPEAYNNIKLSTTEYNSAHNNNAFSLTYNISNSLSIRPASRDDIYESFVFVKDPGIIALHTPPKFKIIKEKFPNTKIIIISFTDNEQSEILANSFYKNGIESLKRNNFEPNNPEALKLCITYFQMFNKPYNEKLSNILELEQVFLKMEQDIIKGDSFLHYYKNSQIPEDYVDKTLILSYYDICHNKNKIIEQLLNFSSRKFIDQKILDFYDSYLTGRENLIKTHMPWIKI